MKNLALTYLPYSIKLKKPFRTSKTVLEERTGFFLVLRNEDGDIGTGEAAPLPDFGSESYDDDENALANFNLKLNIDTNNIENSIEENLSPFNSLPALKYGLELAILNLICNEKKLTMHQLLKRKYSEYLFVNGVISFMGREDAAISAAELVKEGFETLKVKVGRNDFEEDLLTIKKIRETAGSGIKIRIDVNGKWNKNEAMDYLTRLEKFDIQYAEQPVNNFEGFVFLKNKVKIPLAPDESIRNFSDAEKFISNKAASFLVLKPMMLGGIIPALKIADFASENNIQTVITSSFETVIGRTGIVNTAGFVNNNLAHGLGVSGYFDEGDIADPFPVKNGKIIFR
jgi:o-succinylbenzoate synthase